jgi:hypothetical protein
MVTRVRQPCKPPGLDRGPGPAASVGSRGATLALAPGEVHVWLTTPEAIADPALLAGYAAWMNPEEAARQARFLFDRHRHQFLVARALVRTTLSRYAAIDPRGTGASSTISGAGPTSIRRTASAICASTSRTPMA